MTREQLTRSLCLVARRALALGLCAAGLAPLGCVSVEGDVPEVVMTRHALAIGPSPLPTGFGEVSQTVSFEHPYQSFSLPDGVQSELRPTWMSVTAVKGVEDLAFIRACTLVMATRDPAGPAATTVVDYSREPPGTPGACLTADAVNRPNVVDYWVSGSTFYTLTVVGDLPPTPWAVDVEVAFSGSVKYQM
ncbi:MAG: hypothetical protein JW940_19530 [Polyangiaceae bacterium]|nr:hypothetical protein [Polyangiaceae bacterium]